MAFDANLLARFAVEQFDDVIDALARCRQQFGTADLEQHVAERDHHAAIGFAVFHVLEPTLQAGRCFRGQFGFPPRQPDLGRLGFGQPPRLIGLLACHLGLSIGLYAAFIGGHGLALSTLHFLASCHRVHQCLLGFLARLLGFQSRGAQNQCCTRILDLFEFLPCPLCKSFGASDFDRFACQPDALVALRVCQAFDARAAHGIACVDDGNGNQFSKLAIAFQSLELSAETLQQSDRGLGRCTGAKPKDQSECGNPFHLDPSSTRLPKASVISSRRR